MKLSLSGAEDFVSQAPSAQWNGWDINIYRPDDSAWMKRAGAFYKGKWCLVSIIEPTAEGEYVISPRYAANANKSWN